MTLPSRQTLSSKLETATVVTVNGVTGFEVSDSALEDPESITMSARLHQSHEPIKAMCLSVH